MLDSETKRRIDSCRDILVGKVPDPKSQVEQITIALIYKFMDDMDTQAESFGGHRTFFSGEFARYAWSQLLAPGVGGHQTIGLYSEAIARMNENPGIPTLFRDIFKNAYLPYRDPETLRAFLKEINTFSYDHSERLGDAFEYLLSVLGSQGDAGQFRTPRHIIDFIVRIVNPTASDRVLDPACGTAGFLISAYKHILEQNKTTRAGDKLTPDQRKRLVENFHGYDISPDMVRLSLANMYLHGFTQPKIYEYDTLTSEERWNETADVILANPPFMSPKGGIRPHRRFSVQATRSEVLFVDYIAEHLSPTGRAGVIVPEGIIFQSQTAYKQLRKILVEKYLVAVISLPSGVFQPYSGVKTSILVFDRALARRSNHIAFFKVENDGYGLGAQRREMDKNDLPDILVAMREYVNLGGDMELLDSDAQEIQSDSSSSLLKSLVDSGRALMVPKEKIAANGDYNLSGERYRENITDNCDWPYVKLSEICEIARGGSPRPISDYITNDPNGVNWIKIGDAEVGEKYIKSTKEKITIEGTRKSRHVKPGDFILSNSMSFGRPYIMATDGYIHDGWLLLSDIKSVVDQDFLYHILGSKPVYKQFKQSATGGVVNNLNSEKVREVKIPLPPLEVQKEIVAEIEGYQKVIDGARAVLENYRPHIPIHPDWLDFPTKSRH
jgi:type I restriction enzyme M protein